MVVMVGFHTFMYDSVWLIMRVIYYAKKSTGC
ncbi:hypothetical protein C7391_0023 [Methanimicrococcus blatticola]|uniref:Uncharacterized protein n=1 Tax=Methanimicrococcus blatticola TaxID=91560 RepID=A0A484F591_9EURY|nr:hypothetical protein C7391_0023 [Methanimicrococcus blatticola]